ncbi:hypothetical protein PUR71_12875 [Streptomyces sp. SP17BM10]|uniref:hypothetical protein n=1 Tax=Streptomyces sp. SP17BM10 TaxID=3002530 RepID=UPI002E78D79A|nr:hypothetical protein [Streptomyces sp. SP17BM10]MEE1783793.1 hypothetical protein [Streptomyces sp. SP17BM10]
MTSDQRRPLWRPFSEPAADLPVQASPAARLTAVERAPFLEPAPAPAVAAAAEAAQPAVNGTARRPLDPGSLATSATSG